MDFKDEKEDATDQQNPSCDDVKSPCHLALEEWNDIFNPTMLFLAAFKEYCAQRHIHYLY